MDEFPVEVMTEILARLPVRSILRSRSVSKTWKDIIDNHVSPTLHLDRDVALGKNLPASFIALNACDPCRYVGEEVTCRTYLVEQEEEGGLTFKATDVNFPELTTYRKLDLVHFARGLFNLCYYSPLDIKGEQICHDSICNPFTGKYLHLPLILAHEIEKGRNLGGFGYDPSTGEFKVIRAYFYYHTAETDFLVYTLGSNSWRKIENFPQEEYIDMRGESSLARKSVSIYNMLHWFSNHNGLLLTFDIASENFGHMQLPVPISSTYPSLYNLNGCLSYGDGYIDGHDYCDLWVMKDYGVAESWTKLVIFLGSDSVLRVVLILRFTCVVCQSTCLSKCIHIVETSCLLIHQIRRVDLEQGVFRDNQNIELRPGVVVYRQVHSNIFMNSFTICSGSVQQ